MVCPFEELPIWTYGRELGKLVYAFPELTQVSRDDGFSDEVQRARMCHKLR